MTPTNIPTKKIKLISEKPLSEADVEGDNRKFAKKKGVLFEKFTSPSKRSVPDDVLTFPNGLIAFVEYKAPGKFPTLKQWEDHKKRRDSNCLVYVVDDIHKGRAIIEFLIKLDEWEGGQREIRYRRAVEHTRKHYVSQKSVA
jgi:hypothetical protein